MHWPACRRNDPDWIGDCTCGAGLLGQERSISVAFEFTPAMLDGIAILAGIPIAELSQDWDEHIERGTQ